MKPNAKRLPLVLLIVVLLSMLLSSCSVEQGTAPSRRLVDASMGSAPAKVDPKQANVVDMRVRTMGTSPLEATWQYISGAEEFNNKLDSRLFGLFDASTGRYEPAVTAVAQGPLSTGMSITHEVILATGSVVGARLVQTKLVNGAVAKRTEEITYEDLTTGVTSTSATLINPHEIGTLRTMLSEVPLPATSGLGNSARSPEPSSRASGASSSSTSSVTVPQPIRDVELLSAVAFTPAGQLSVSFDKDLESGSQLANPITLTLSEGATEQVLSQAGQSLRQAVRSAAAFAASAPVPGAQHINCDLVPCAALTYDDGPNPQTSRLLEILAKHRVSATFFEQGSYVSSYPQVSKAVAEAGHVIANHTMSHPYLTKLSAAGITKEVQGAQAVIEKASGTVPVYLRPPYGATNAAVASVGGMPQIMWSVDSLDWQSRNKDVFVPRIMSLVKPGAVILQHDIHASTVDGQEELITQLQRQGYYLVTVPKLFAGIQLAPGGSYKCRGTAPGCVPGR